MNTYPTSRIGGDGQVVVIQFDDGIKFEVLPAFVNKGGGYSSTLNSRASTRPLRGQMPLLMPARRMRSRTRKNCSSPTRS